MQYVKRWYTPVVDTLILLILVAFGTLMFIQCVGWEPYEPYDANQMVEIELLSPMETVVATGAGPDPATVTLSSGIWDVELDINTENYEGITLQSVEPGGGSALKHWDGRRRAIVVTAADRSYGALYPGETRVRTGALPGYKWTVTFTRHDVQ